MNESISTLANRLKTARSVVILTGAGVSAESGLRTFRGGEKDMSSLWKEFDPATLATPEAFEANPEMVSRWYDWRRLGCLAAEPNAGHLALAQMEAFVVGRASSAAPPRPSPRRGGGSFTLLTQNVDRLHQRLESECCGAVWDDHGVAVYADGGEGGAGGGGDDGVSDAHGGGRGVAAGCGVVWGDVAARGGGGARSWWRGA